MSSVKYTNKRGKPVDDESDVSSVKYTNKRSKRVEKEYDVSSVKNSNRRGKHVNEESDVSSDTNGNTQSETEDNAKSDDDEDEIDVSSDATTPITKKGNKDCIEKGIVWAVTQFKTLKKYRQERGGRVKKGKYDEIIHQACHKFGLKKMVE